MLRSLQLLQRAVTLVTCRRGMVQGRKGLVIGAYESCGEAELKLTPAGRAFDARVQGRMTTLIKGSGIKLGNGRVYHGLDGFYAVAVTGLGPEGLATNDQELLDECRENVRWAAGLGTRLLHRQECCHVSIDPMQCPEAAAEGSKLGNWSYQAFRDPADQVARPETEIFSEDQRDQEEWVRGATMADAQNIARTLEDTPANHLTPRAFAEEAIKILCPCGVHVNVRATRWIEDHRMLAYLNMAKGSCEPPFFLELNYCGGAESDRPVVLVGMGSTFDSGGLCLKACRGHGYTPYQDMADFRGAMAGAAVIVGTMKAIARMGIPINLTGLIPLMENMPGGMSVKPGDVLLSLAGKTIRVEDTDNEGHVALADALAYSDYFKPCLDVSVATLTPGAKIALGSGGTPTFSSSQIVWDEMKKAGSITGDRVWRFPLWKNYMNRVAMCDPVDVCNVGKGGPLANPCLGAAFLYHFVPGCDFMHLDITGTGMKTRGVTAPYLRENQMTGRPTRTVIQFINQMACPLDSHTRCSSS